MATTRLFTPRPYDEFDSGVVGVAPILATGTDVDNTKVAAVQAAAAANGLGTLPTSAGGTAPAPVAEPLRFRGAWQANTVYSYGDAVTNGGSLWVAPISFTSGSSFVSANWTKLGVYDATDPSLFASYTPAFVITDTTLTDIVPTITAAIAAGSTHIYIPDKGSTWPWQTKLTATGVWIEFQPGAQVDLGDQTGLAADLTACRLTNGYFTSSHTGPTSAADNPESGGSSIYAYDARGIRLRDDCVVQDHYQENCATGIEFFGQRIRAKNLRFKNIRQYQGWGAAVHSGSNPGNVPASAMHHCEVEGVWVEDSDRACEIEAGSTYNTLTHGYLSNIGPVPYTGQPASFATYTFCVSVHSHSGEAACIGNVYRDWYIKDSQGGIVAQRSSGTNDSDMPVGNVFENITIDGFTSTTGHHAIDLQGHENIVRARLLPGAGITSLMNVMVQDGNSNGNDIDILEASAYTAPLVQVGSTNLCMNNRVRVRKVGTPTGTAAYLIDVYALRTLIDLDVDGVTGTLGYVRLNTPASYSTVRGYLAVAGSETFSQAILVGAKDCRVGDLRVGSGGPTTIPDVATTGGVVGLVVDGFHADRSGGASINLGGATIRCIIGTDTYLGSGYVTDSGTNNTIPRPGELDYESTLGSNPALMASVNAGGSMSWPTASQAVIVRRRAQRRLSIAKLRWTVGTQSGNYDICILDDTGKVLWAKGSTAVPAGGTLVEESFTAVNILRGAVYYIGFVFDNTTASMKGLAMASGNPTASLTGKLTATYVASSFPFPAAASTVTVGTTPSLRLPAISVHEA